MDHSSSTKYANIRKEPPNNVSDTEEESEMDKMRDEILQMINSQTSILEKMSRFTGVNENLNIQKNVISPNPSFFSSNSAFQNQLNSNASVDEGHNDYFGGNTIKPKLVLDLDETLVNSYI